jgi:hypothetical protein
MVTPVAHREAVAHLRTAYEMSERRACCIIGCDPASVRYQAKRRDDALWNYDECWPFRRIDSVGYRWRSERRLSGV